MRFVMLMRLTERGHEAPKTTARLSKRWQFGVDRTRQLSTNSGRLIAFGVEDIPSVLAQALRSPRELTRTTRSTDIHRGELAIVPAWTGDGNGVVCEDYGVR